MPSLAPVRRALFTGLCVCACSHGTPAAGPTEASHASKDPTPAPATESPIEPDTDAPAPARSVKPAPAPTDTLTIAPGSHRTLRAAVVRSEPSATGAELGVLAAGVRIPRAAPVVNDDCRSGWIPVQPVGFVCTELELDRRPPTTETLPRVPAGMRVPGAYGRVGRDGAKVFASLADALADRGRTPEASLTVRRLDTVRSGGRTFWRTRLGLIETKHIRRLRGSGFHGIELGPEGLQTPVVWTLGTHERQTVAVRRRPQPGSRVVARLPKRQPHRLLERDPSGRWVRIETGWLAVDDVRISESVPRPDGVGESERWLDIDISQQTLVAYEGDRPVYATLVSSGRARHRTPTGVFRIDRKVAERTMNSMADSDELYSVERVPWTAYFAKGYALHAAFWHQGFGTRRSHGCINLAPLDARHLYDWTAPLVAPGWAEVFGHEDQPGSAIQIRSRRDPEPDLRGYAVALAETATADAPTG